MVETGPRTYLGGIASSMMTQQVETSFDKGIKKFTYLMLGFMLVMVPAVFFINALSKSPSTVEDGDVLALAALAAKISAKSDPVSAFVFGELGQRPSRPGFHQHNRLGPYSVHQPQRHRLRAVHL